MDKKRLLWIAGIIILIFALASCGGGGDSDTSGGDEEATVASKGDPDAGKVHYDSICIACHGPTGEGMEGLGKPFTTSEFVKNRTDDQMVEFLKVGRPSGDPLNTTGVDMPPKGGNPALTDDDLYDIIAFVRTLQKRHRLEAGHPLRPDPAGSTRLSHG